MITRQIKVCVSGCLVFASKTEVVGRVWKTRAETSDKREYLRNARFRFDSVENIRRDVDDSIVEHFFRHNYRNFHTVFGVFSFLFNSTLITIFKNIYQYTSANLSFWNSDNSNPFVSNWITRYCNLLTYNSGPHTVRRLRRQ